MKLLVACFLGIVLMSPKVGVCRLDGNTLLAHCNQAIKSIDGDDSLSLRDRNQAALCYGFAFGVLAMATAHVSIPVPQNVTVDQVIRIIVKSLSESPKELNEPGEFLAIAALLDAYHTNISENDNQQAN